MMFGWGIVFVVLFFKGCLFYVLLCVFNVFFHNNMVKSNKSGMGSGQETSATVMLFKQIQTYVVD
jgi:hypothetical protein